MFMLMSIKGIFLLSASLNTSLTVSKHLCKGHKTPAHFCKEFANPKFCKGHLTFQGYQCSSPFVAGIRGFQAISKFKNKIEHL